MRRCRALADNARLPHWKAQGWLAPFKAPGFEHLPSELRDPDGHYYPVLAYGFSNVVDTAQIPEDQAPREATDYLKPQLKDRLVFSYPHDDDAVLFQFEQMIRAHDWPWLEALLRQNPQWERGTQAPLEIVATGMKAATFTSFYYLKPEAGSSVRFLLPRDDFFQSWYQLGASLKAAPHPAAARLYMSFLLSEESTAGAPVARAPGHRADRLLAPSAGIREHVARRLQRVHGRPWPNGTAQRPFRAVDRPGGGGHADRCTGGRT